MCFYIPSKVSSDFDVWTHLGKSVSKTDIKICSKIKAHTKFYMVQQLSMSIGLCLDAKISIDLVQGYN